MKEIYMDFNKEDGPAHASPEAPKPGPSNGVELTATHPEGETVSNPDPTAQDTKDQSDSDPIDMAGVQYTEEPRYTGNLKSDPEVVETIDKPKAPAAE